MSTTGAESGASEPGADAGVATDRTRAALAAVVFAVLFGQVLLYPGVDTLVRALGAASALGGSMWFLAAEFAAFVLFAPLWGLASDARGERVPLVRAGALGGAAGYAALAGLPQVMDLSLGTVLAIRIAQGAATIGAFSLAMTMLMDLSGGHGRNMGAAGIAIGLGTALGAPVGGLLYGLGPFVPLTAAAVLLVLVAAGTTRLTDRPPTADGEDGRIVRAVAELRATPALAVPFAFGFIDRLSAGVFALVGTLYFRTVFGLSPAATGAMLMCFFAPFALLQYPFGARSDRTGRRVPVVAGSLAYGVVVAAVGLAPTVLLAGATMVVVGVVGAFMSPATMALVTDLASERTRGAAMAGYNAAGSVGFLVGILLGGSVAGAAGYRTAFFVTGGLEVAVAVLALPAVLRVTAK